VSEPTPLVEAPKSRGKLYAIIAAALVVVIAAIIAIVSFSNANNQPAATGSGAAGSTADSTITEGPGSAEDPVRIGVVGASDPYWADYVEAAAAEGISIELVDFSEYNQPNPAVAEGDLDLNQFQHSVYLAQYNIASEKDLVPIGSTAIYPLALFSTKYESVEDIKDGDTIAIPNDPSNLARALLVLQSAGLVELKDGGSIFATLDDIDAEKSRVQVTALEAALTATSLPDVAGAIINNDFIDDAGLEASDAIAQDDPADENAIPYINIFATREDDAENEVYLRLVEIFQNSSEVIDGLVENSGDTAVPVKTSVADLKKTLLQVEKDTAAQG
jgi:D-methionine transport system substrate-binding protein